MKMFYGKKTHIIATIIGITVATYSTYWLGRSDEIQQIIDVVGEYGDITLEFYNRTNKKKIPIHMYVE